MKNAEHCTKHLILGIISNKIVSFCVFVRKRKMHRNIQNNCTIHFRHESEWEIYTEIFSTIVQYTFRWNKFTFRTLEIMIEGWDYLGHLFSFSAQYVQYVDVR